MVLKLYYEMYSLHRMNQILLTKETVGLEGCVLIDLYN